MRLFRGLNLSGQLYGGGRIDLMRREVRIYVDAVGWTPAKSLESGDMLLGAGSTLPVVANEHEAHPNGVTVP